MIHASANVHPTAVVEAGATVGKDARIWHFCHVRERAVIGEGVSLGRDGYVDNGVSIGRGSRIQNGVSLYDGVTVGEWCFIGPHAIFTNDAHPRVGKISWNLEKTQLHNGMSIGAGVIIRCGVSIGAFALVGAGALVTKDIPPFTLCMGVPAEPVSLICACGDTRIPFGTFGQDLVLDCCRSSLRQEVLELAEREAALTQP